MNFEASSKSQNQHYVPKTYLKRFANLKEQVTVKDITKPDKPEFPSHIKKICREHGIYDLSTLGYDGVPANAYEKLLGEIEEQYSIRLQKSIDQGYFPSLQEIGMINMFVICQLFRTPKYHSLISNRMREILSEHPKVEFAAVALAHTIKGVPQLLEYAEYEIIKVAKGKRFITSDHPASAWLNKGINWEQVTARLEEDCYKYLKIICSLSPEFLLVIKPLSLEPGKYTPRGSNEVEVNKFNSLIQTTAYKFIIL